jgi:hypothetical protein
LVRLYFAGHLYPGLYFRWVDGILDKDQGAPAVCFASFLNLPVGLGRALPGLFVSSDARLHNFPLRFFVESVRPVSTFALTLPAPCGQSPEIWMMSLRTTLTVAAILAAGPALSQDLSFTISNLSSADLVEFYASPVGNDNWEENMLAGAVLAAGQSGQVTISEGGAICNYDLRMVFSDGESVEDRRNLCETGSYTIQ